MADSDDASPADDVGDPPAEEYAADEAAVVVLAADRNEAKGVFFLGGG